MTLSVSDDGLVGRIGQQVKKVLVGGPSKIKFCLRYSSYLLFPVTITILICMVVLFPLCVTYIAFVSVTRSFIRTRQNVKKLARSFNSTFCYIDDVLSLNNCKFGDFVDPIKLEIKDTTNTERSTSYLELHLEIDSDDRLRTKLYVKISHCELSIHVYQLSSSTSIWSIYLSVDPIFQSLWFLS